MVTRRWGGKEGKGKGGREGGMEKVRGKRESERRRDGGGVPKGNTHVINRELEYQKSK